MTQPPNTPWRRRGQREQFPGVPAWGAPTMAVAPEPFDVIRHAALTPRWAWGGADGGGVRVCVVDTGVDGGHPMVGRVDQATTVADAGNGTVRIEDTPAVDRVGHGTACAGIIRSLAPAVSLSSVQVLTDGKTGSGQALLTGLAWAIDEGYDVINLSISTVRSEYCLALYELADRAYFSRCTLVVSAHNMPVRSFPWTFASVISVASHNEPDSMVFHYNPSPPVEFYARGVNVPVAWPESGQVRSTGNSFAAPHIAGICALVLSKHRWLTPFQLKSVLYLTATNVAAGAGGVNGG